MDSNPRFPGEGELTRRAVHGPGPVLALESRIDDGRTLALSRVQLAAEGTEGSSKKLSFAASQKH